MIFQIPLSNPLFGWAARWPSGPSWSEGMQPVTLSEAAGSACPLQAFSQSPLARQAFSQVRLPFQAFPMSPLAPIKPSQVSACISKPSL